MIPQFKNTQEALDYGKEIKNSDFLFEIGKQDLIRELKDARLKAQTEYLSLLSQGKESEALFLASGQMQFIREAIEEVEKV